MTPILPARISVYQGDGMSFAAHAMHGQLRQLEVHSQNLSNYGVPGYHKQTPILRPFIEYLGAGAVETSTSEKIGRLRQTGYPNDLALSSEGYFQRLDANTQQLSPTRDGRTQLDKDGYLRGLDGTYFLDVHGRRIHFAQQPKDYGKEVKIHPNGDIQQLDPKTGRLTIVARLGVVSSQGSLLSDVKVQQGVVEDSNVFLAEEYAALLPIRRYFEANSQVFKIQNQSLSRMVQELGRSQ
jgi:flagellar basal-body rod protein FlgF